MTERYEIAAKAVVTMLEEKKYTALREILTTMNPVDIAALFAGLQDRKIPVLFRLLPKELAAETFVEMDEDTQEFLIHGFSDNELKEVVDELFVDDAVDLIEEMPANVVKRILRQADKETRRQINELLKYPEDSAGSIMTTEFISLRPDMTAEMAIKRIRRTGVDKETIYTCYVNDDYNRLIGITTVKDLLLADDDDLVKDMMEENVISVHTLDDQEMVARIFSDYDFLALPVVDNEQRIVGIGQGGGVKQRIAVDGFDKAHKIVVAHKEGARVIGCTLLGRINGTYGKYSPLRLAVQCAQRDGGVRS